MKIRNGFVSNSSSSSFIIRADEEFSSVKEVASYIMETIIDKWDANFEDEIRNLNQLSNPDTPVFINTGGDDTYIRRHPEKNGDVFIIVTTQNVDFDKITNSNLQDHNVSSEFYNEFRHEYEEYPEDSYTPNSTSDFDYYYKRFNDFLILKHGVFGRHEYFQGDETNKIKHTNNCFYKDKSLIRGWLLKNGEKVCICQIDKIMRKIKLEKLSNKK